MMLLSTPEPAPDAGVAEKLRREETSDRASDRLNEGVEVALAGTMFPRRVGDERLIVCTYLDCSQSVELE